MLVGKGSSRQTSSLVERFGPLLSLLSFSPALGANRCFDYFFLFSWICLHGVPIAQPCWIKGFISLSLLYGPVEVSSSLWETRATLGNKFASNYRRRPPHREITDALTSFCIHLWCFGTNWSKSRVGQSQDQICFIQFTFLNYNKAFFFFMHNRRDDVQDRNHRSWAWKYYQ